MPVKNLRIQAYHKDQKRIVQLTGIIGMDGETMLRTAETTVAARQVDFLLYSGKNDQNGTEIYDQTILSYIVTNPKTKKPDMFIGWVEFEDGCFKLCYYERVEIQNVATKKKDISIITHKLLQWDSSQAKVLGNKYQHADLLTK